jgi:hypothetical protein
MPLAGVPASVAAYETEVRKERQLECIARAKAEGKRWVGRGPGTRIRLTEEKEALARQLHAEGKPVAAIARLVGLSRKSEYKAIGRRPNPPEPGRMPSSERTKVTPGYVRSQPGSPARDGDFVRSFARFAHADISDDRRWTGDGASLLRHPKQPVEAAYPQHRSS